VLAAGELGYEVDTTQMKIGDGATSWENLAYSAVSSSYIDNAIANVIDMAPGALDTLAELAAAINDDNNFFSTVTNSIANAVSDHDNTTVNVHGIANTADLVVSSDLAPYALVATTDDLQNNVSDLSNNIISVENNFNDLNNTVNNISTSVNDNANDISTLDNTVLGLSNTINQVSSDLSNTSSELAGDISDLDNTVTQISADLSNAVSDISELDNAVQNVETVLGNVTSTEISYLANVSSNLQTQINAKAPSADPTFTGVVILPATTSIGDINNVEIGYLDNVSSNIQQQLDAKLAASSAASIYAPLTDPTFINSVVLPANTAIGTVTSTEIGYLDNVTSSIQTQLNSKAPTADPTFTGTVSGITKTMVGLGNVDNTSDLDKPISNATQSALDLKAPLANATFTGTISLPSTTSIGDISATEIGHLDNVSSNIQTQIDGKLSLSGGTMTGAITLSADPTQALHAATKQYVDNISAGLHIHEATHAATTDTLANLVSSTVTYDNGTDGVGATLTLGANLTTLDGHTLSNGDRILVKNQANTAHNGIYVRTSATVLTRADDFNSAAEIAGGDFVFVENGTLYNSTGWVVENEVNIVGTDPVLWAQFSGAGTVTAGNNISVSGLQVSVADSPSFTGTVTLPATTSIGPVSATEIGYLDNVSSNIQTQIDAKANTASPTFTGLVTVAANGIAFTDGTQTKQGVPSITVITPKTTSYTLSSLDERDTIIEISNASATTLTIPTNSTVAYPIGTTIDIIQTGAGQVTIANAVGVTLNATPGTKLRTQWSSATLLKRDTNTWLAYGDLSA
jgi:archaellum component FlaC